ncbi:MAG: CAP domain-containing protein, partial [Spirochaetaceae bacterium]|nr:CAP domain-containing protein [Spirochaetaceae bacterium]
MKKNRLILAAALLIWVSAASEAYPDQSDDQIINTINEIRVSHGLHYLSEDSAAASAAKEHADELALRHTLSHWGLDGSRVAERYRSAGGTGISAGENLGA